MKRTTAMCVFSAVAGACISLAISHSRSVEPAAVAQDGPALPPANVGPELPLRQPQPTPAPLPGDDLTPEERVNVAVYDNANRGVVNITTKGFQGERFLMIEVPSEGEGSGVVLDRQGHILTNYHVVDGARQIQVTLFDGKTYEAKLKGQDPATDVAVIQIAAPPQSLFPVQLGSSTQLRVGQRVYAIGNPFGLERTLTTGIISSLNRSLAGRRGGRALKSLIQIDAAINPGNSGGPLLDSHSRMIGMNTAIYSKSGQSAGVGFAIPVSTIARVLPQLLSTGRVLRPDAGIAVVHPTEHGLMVVKLTPGGPAERAGLQGPRVVRQEKRQGPFVFQYQTIDRAAADLIVAVDGKPVKTGDDYLDAIESKRPGDRVVLTAVRNGQQRQILLILEAAE
jgi:S1-C subfamily serine protease